MSFLFHFRRRVDVTSDRFDVASTPLGCRFAFAPTSVHIIMASLRFCDCYISESLRDPFASMSIRRHRVLTLCALRFNLVQFGPGILARARYHCEASSRTISLFWVPPNTGNRKTMRHHQNHYTTRGYSDKFSRFVVYLLGPGPNLI